MTPSHNVSAERLDDESIRDLIAAGNNFADCARSIVGAATDDPDASEAFDMFFAARDNWRIRARDMLASLARQSTSPPAEGGAEPSDDDEPPLAAGIRELAIAVTPALDGYHDLDRVNVTGPAGLLMSVRVSSLRRALASLSPEPTKAGVVVPRPLADWSEDDGDVVWWCWRNGEWLGEPAYIGTPLDLGQTVEIEFRSNHGNDIQSHMVGGWPGYHTHWTPHPALPAPVLPPQEQGKGADDDWIEWKGGSVSPIEPATVEIKHRDGQTSTVYAGHIDWNHWHGPFDVVAYRVVRP